MFKLLQTRTLSKILSEDKLKQYWSECYLFYFNFDYVCACKWW